jgi:hypothetical protein
MERKLKDLVEELEDESEIRSMAGMGQQSRYRGLEHKLISEME